MSQLIYVLNNEGQEQNFADQITNIINYTIWLVYYVFLYDKIVFMWYS